MARLKPLRILIIGNYGAGNLGDEAILAGILNEIRKKDWLSSWAENLFPKKEFNQADLQISVLSYRPAETTMTHGVKSFYLMPLGFRSILRGIFGLQIFETLAAIRRADLIVFGGGGLFSEPPFMAILLWGWQFLVTQFFKKAVFHYAQSVGPLKKSISKSIVRWVFKAGKGISVRDKISFELLKSLGISQEIQIRPDPAFSLKPILVERIASGEKNLKNFYEQNAISDKEYVVVSLRDWPQFTFKEKKEIAVFLDYLVKEFAWEVICVPFQELKNSDMLVFKEVISLMKESPKVILKSYDSDFWAILALIFHSKAVIGMRLHSLIFAEMTDKPFIGLIYSQKVTAFLAEIGKKEWGIKLDEIKAERLKSLFNRF